MVTVRHEGFAVVVRCLGTRDQVQLLDVTSEVLVLEKLLADKDDSSVGDVRGRVSGKELVCGGLTINEEGDAVPLHAQTQPVPLPVVNRCTEFQGVVFGWNTILVLIEKPHRVPDLHQELVLSRFRVEAE